MAAPTTRHPLLLTFTLQLTLLLTLVTTVSAQGNCPSDKCRCRRSFWRIVMQCSDLQGAQVPAFTGNSYRFYDVSFRASCIRRIQQRAFVNITTSDLRLQDLCVETIERSAFEGVGQDLTGLHLDNNTIRDLPDGIFRHMPNLMYLSLSNNRIRDVPPSVFADLSHLQFLYLYR